MCHWPLSLLHKHGHMPDVGQIEIDTTPVGDDYNCRAPNPSKKTLPAPAVPPYGAGLSLRL